MPEPNFSSRSGKTKPCVSSCYCDYPVPHGQRFRTIQNLISILTYNSNLLMNGYNLVHNRSQSPQKSLKQLIHLLVEQVSIIPSLTNIIESWLNNYSNIVYWYTMVHKGLQWYTMVHNGSQRFTKVHKGSQRLTKVHNLNSAFLITQCLHK